jgi:hypothetical protein
MLGWLREARKRRNDGVFKERQAKKERKKERERKPVG